MNSLKSFIYGAVALMSMGLVACQDNFDDPKMEAPVAKNVANTTIAELKAKFWQDETNYIWQGETNEPQPIGLKEDGSHYIIHGRVISSAEIGKLIKQHNNANVLVMPARFVSFETVLEITDAWLNEEFEGGRHQGRIDKIPVK